MASMNIWTMAAFFSNAHDIVELRKQGDLLAKNEDYDNAFEHRSMADHVVVLLEKQLLLLEGQMKDFTVVRGGTPEHKYFRCLWIFLQFSGKSEAFGWTKESFPFEWED